MGLEDEYDSALKRWTNAVVIWNSQNCPESGDAFNKMQRLDKKLKNLADKCINEEERNKND